MKQLDNNERWEQMGRYLSNEASTDEVREVEAWIRSSREAEEMWLNAKKSWDESQYALQFHHIDNEAAWSKVSRQMNPPKSIFKHWNYLATIGVAASLLLVVGWFLIQQLAVPHQVIVERQLVVSEKAVELLMLADGSSINLNGGSKLSYPEAFPSDNRLVKLEGEAFFSVAPDKNRPFLVNAGDVEVQVLGTAFNVKAYPNQPTIEVTVEHGTVKVSGASGEVTLTAGYLAVFDKTSGTLRKLENTNINYQSWKTKRLEFDQANMDEVIRVLEQVYKVDVVVTDPSILDLKISARFDQNTLDYVLKVISRTFKLEYSAQGDVVMLARDEMH
jgi:ferric-dicitrate binding protein FerR (iron transport regulator)